MQERRNGVCFAVTLRESLVGDYEAQEEGTKHVVVGAVARKFASIFNGFGD